MNENRFYNYVYLDPRNKGNFTYITEKGIISFDYEPFYVGKGTKNRYKQHFNGRTGRFMRSKLKRLKSLNIQPEIVVFNKDSTNQEVCQIEKTLISQIGRRDLKRGPLCNHTNGGEEGYGQVVTKRTRALKRLQNLGKKLSEEHKRKIGQSNSISLKGKPSNKKGKKSPNSNVAVIKTDLEGNYIEEYKSMYEAAEINNVKYTFVQDQCRFPKTKPRYNKFKFKYKDDKRICLS